MSFNNPFANNASSKQDNVNKLPQKPMVLPLPPKPAGQHAKTDERDEIKEDLNSFFNKSTNNMSTEKQGSSAPLPNTANSRASNTQVNSALTNLPTTPNYPPQAVVGDNAVFNSLLDSDEDELDLSPKQNKSGPQYFFEGEDPLLKEIEAEQKRLKRVYPTGGGIKVSRFVTADILMKAPADYFDKYVPEITEGVKWVRTNLTQNSRSEIIGQAQNHPTDESYQNEAYYVVYSLASEYMEKSMWRGVHKAIVISYICNEIIGFGRIDPLWRDRKIDEIMCNGPYDIQVEIRGELYKVPACKFNNADHLMELLERLYRAIGKNLSQTTPQAKGRLHDKSRIYATHQIISPDGPNFNIRRHPEGYWTPEALVERNAASPELMSYIGNVIHKGGSFVVIGGTHSGKALTLDTKIKTPTGDITMGDIKTGDIIFDHNGKPTTVTHIFDNPARQVYRIKFSNGTHVDCDLNHNWLVSTPETRKLEKTGKNPYQVKTTEELLSHELTINTEKGTEYFYNIPKIVEPIEYSETPYSGLQCDELPIHPYLLGLWLGKGPSTGKFAVSDTKKNIETISQKLEEQNIEHTVTHNNNMSYINVTKFSNVLEDLGLLQTETDNHSRKYVPEVYKTASIEARKFLVAGLIDSKGWAEKPGIWGFKNTNPHIIKNFTELVSSLGYATRQYSDNSAFNNDGESVVIVKSFDNLGFLDNGFSDSDVPYSVLDSIAIVSIEKLDGRIENMRCITVDSKDHTYLVGETFITTHNTSMLNALTGFYKPKVRIITIEDNLEMKPNPKKFLAAALETRPPSLERANDHGVSMRDLVKGSLQMRPDVIIVGEVTDDAAYDLCQALNTGHAGASTIHANGSEQAMTRIASLIAQGGLVTTDGALDMIASAFDIVVSIKHFPLDGSRRIVSVDEVGMEPIEVAGRQMLPTRQLWRFVDTGLDNNGKVTGYWEQTGDISKERKNLKLLDLEEDLSWVELRELSSLPEGQERA